jgi:hypothetical protein
MKPIEEQLQNIRGAVITCLLYCLFDLLWHFLGGNW